MKPVMSPDTLAILKLNVSCVPLENYQRGDLITWLRSLADEFAAGEHWGASVFALSQRPAPIHSEDCTKNA